VFSLPFFSASAAPGWTNILAGDPVRSATESGSVVAGILLQESMGFRNDGSLLERAKTIGASSPEHDDVTSKGKWRFAGLGKSFVVASESGTR
jgi:hypothetical protein